ncbi:hypothetical protein GF340_05095 [Candidatus Peregrinibacteria bacterium]|nr:hypothetical protein [Candidatus Peregrinibacteria bacterium]
MIKTIKILPIAAMISLLMVSQAYALVSYTDVNSETDYEDSITWLTENGVIEGYSDGSFKPKQDVNRVEFLKMIYLVQGLESEIPETNSDSGFNDVEGDQWYAKYVAFAKERETVEGYPDGSFGPGKSINRAEATKIILNEFAGTDVANYYETLSIAEKTGSEFMCNDHFAEDINVEDWYAKYMMHANKLCLFADEMFGDMEGTDDKIYPSNDMTRGETAEMLYRAKAYKDNDVPAFNKFIFPDDVLTAEDILATADDFSITGDLNSTQVQKMFDLLDDYRNRLTENPSADMSDYYTDELKTTINNYLLINRLFKTNEEGELTEDESLDGKNLMDLLLVPSWPPSLHTAQQEQFELITEEEGNVQKLLIWEAPSSDEDSMKYGLATGFCIEFVEQNEELKINSTFSGSGKFSADEKEIQDYILDNCGFEVFASESLTKNDLLTVQHTWESEFNYDIYVNGYLVKRKDYSVGLGSLRIPLVDGENEIKVILGDSGKDIISPGLNDLGDTAEGFKYELKFGEDVLFFVNESEGNQTIEHTFNFSII